MDPEEAIKLLTEHDRNCVHLTHVVNSNRGIKGAIKDHRNSAKKLLTAMMGREPSAEELDRATNW